jgi:SAM-dependent methyltransferase
MTITHAEEIRRGQRFEFGENWRRFLTVLNDDRVARATESLVALLGVSDLRGSTFLDVGSGSGLFSLAARRLGASVTSFDFDPASVACTTELRRRYFGGDSEWRVILGSVTDRSFLESLGTFDVVYAWGVLHHTGELWAAIENASRLVRDCGLFVVAVYNDQGAGSRRWLLIKQIYNRLPRALRWLVLGPAFVRLWGPTIARDALRGSPLRTWRGYARESQRGMEPWRDMVDWVGGLPFEVATPVEIVRFGAEHGFTLIKEISRAHGLGCNEFVLRRGGGAHENGCPVAPPAHAQTHGRLT